MDKFCESFSSLYYIKQHCAEGNCILNTFRSCREKEREKRNKKEKEN